MDRLLTRRRFGVLASASLVGLAGCEGPDVEGGEEEGGGGDGDDSEEGADGGDEDGEGNGGEEDDEGGYESDGASRPGPTRR
jgi:hypothetical protein